MKNEWKRSLSRILIAAMLLCTMQGNVVSAATELNESGGTVLTDSILKDDEPTGTIPGDSLVDRDGEGEEQQEDWLTINIGRQSGCVTKIVSSDDVDLAKFIGILQNPFQYSANDEGKYPSVEKLSSENIQECYLKWGAEGQASSLYCDIQIDFYNSNNNNQFSDPNEASYAKITIMTTDEIPNPNVSYEPTVDGYDTNNTYWLCCASGQEYNNSYYAKVFFKFVDAYRVDWLHGATYAGGSTAEKGQGGFKVNNQIVNDIAPTWVRTGESIPADSFPEVVKNGFEFVKWVKVTETENDLIYNDINSNTVITEDTLIEAQWQEYIPTPPPHVHNWEFDTDPSHVTWYGNDMDGYSEASIKKTCTRSGHVGSKSVNVKVNTSSSADGTVCDEGTTRYYTAVFDSTADPDITGSFQFQKTVSTPAKHDWKIGAVKSNGSFEKPPAAASIDIVCVRDASHKETVSASKIELLNSSEQKKTYKYTGTSSDGQLIEAEEVFYPHTEHKWTVSFTWPSVSTNTADTVKPTAVAVCSVGGEKVVLDVQITNKIVGKLLEYTAKATDPAGKVWTAKKNINTKGDVKDGPAGTPTVENGNIVIIGVEETYAFAGTRIKPAVTVMDGDTVLAQSTDYTVSYTGDNKIGASNTVNVKGKGNYEGKSATAKFTIVDPRSEVDPGKLGDYIKKITLSEKEFVYDGKAKYPATVTVSLKEGGDIIYTYDGGGGYTTDSAKEIGISVCNNVNVGSGYVAAIGGKDTTAKKVSFKIKQAEISTAEFEFGEVAWGIKAETPKIITAQYGDLELVAGQDFTVAYTATKAGDTAGIAKINGKGNFKGQHADVAYKVNPLILTGANVIVSAVAGKTVKNVSIKVVDNAGNNLGKKLYTRKIVDMDGNELIDVNAVMPDEFKVVITADGENVKTGEGGVTVVVRPGKSISKNNKQFKVDKNFFKYYTGEPVTLSGEDFGEGKISNPDGLVFGKDFEIAYYMKNVKKGTMTVYLRGIGEYGGTKSIKVNIKAKPLDKAIE